MSNRSRLPALGSAPCECDPTLDYGPNNADCPKHGAEIRHWEAWSRGERRCPYCEGADWGDFVAICDCPQVEREAAP